MTDKKPSNIPSNPPKPNPRPAPTRDRDIAFDEKIKKGHDNVPMQPRENPKKD